MILGAVVVTLAGLAGWWAVRPPARLPRERTVGGTVRLMPVAAACGVGAGVWALVGGVLGMLVALVGAVLVHRWALARPTREQVREAERVSRELPHLVALLAATLRAGADPAVGLAACCDALGGPSARRLAPAIATARLGAPAAAWRGVAADPVLGRLGRVLERTQLTGASVADAVEALADDLAAQLHAGAEDRARRVGVRAAVPLGLCLLPAFMLLGIVPVVGSLLSDLLP